MRQKETCGIHHCVLPWVLRPLVGPPFSLHLSESLIFIISNVQDFQLDLVEGVEKTMPTLFAQNQRSRVGYNISILQKKTMMFKDVNEPFQGHIGSEGQGKITLRLWCSEVQGFTSLSLDRFRSFSSIFSDNVHPLSNVKCWSLRLCKKTASLLIFLLLAPKHDLFQGSINLSLLHGIIYPVI